jgi:predicted PurR-regulated permease PerM
MDKVDSKFFKMYVYVSLFVIIVLLALLVGAVIYGGIKIKSESQTVSNKVNSFNKSVNSVNQNLQNIDSQLKDQTNIASKGLTAL